MYAITLLFCGRYRPFYSPSNGTAVSTTVLFNKFYGISLKKIFLTENKRKSPSSKRLQFNIRNTKNLSHTTETPRSLQVVLEKQYFVMLVGIQLLFDNIKSLAYER